MKSLAKMKLTYMDPGVDPDLDLVSSNYNNSNHWRKTLNVYTNSKISNRHVSVTMLTIAAASLTLMLALVFSMGSSASASSLGRSAAGSTGIAGDAQPYTGNTSTPTRTSTPMPTCSSVANYNVTYVTGIPMEPGTTLVQGTQWTDAVVPITLPFTFNFYGQPFNSVNASTNGNLQFSSNSNIGDSCLPASALSNAILPYMDHLDLDGPGNDRGIYTSTSGLIPFRTFNIEWRGCHYYGGLCGGRISFEVRLYEANDRIDFVYGSEMDGAGNEATLGLQKGTGERWTGACDSLNLSAGLRITYIPPSCIWPTLTATSTTTSTATPTSTQTSTSTDTPSTTPTSTPTSTPVINVLIGHVTFQGPPAQPNSAQQQTITLTLCPVSGGPATSYQLTTDASGLFALTAPAPGNYNWRVKSPRYLANTGVLMLQTGTTNVEMGLEKAGDANNDNVVSVLDFNMVKGSFGKSPGNPGYDERADFNGDNVVSIIDFNLLRGNFGTGGAPINCP